MSWPLPPLDESTSKVDYISFCRGEIEEQLFDQEAPRIFQPEGVDSSIEVELLQIGPTLGIRQDHIRTEKQLKAHCKDIEAEIKTSHGSRKTTDSIARIVCLSAQHSLGKFDITKTGILSLFDAIEAPAEFNTPFMAFGARNKHRDAGFGCFWSMIRCSACPGRPDIAIPQGIKGACTILDTACTYILKHPELHGRTNSAIPWSIRQMAVCQKWSADSKTEISIILQASEGTKSRLDSLAQDGKDSNGILDYSQHWSTVHSLVLMTLNDEWKRFANYWEDNVAAMTVETLFPKLFSPDQEEDDGIQLRIFHKIQECQSTIDWLIRIKQVLQLNIETVEKLSDHVKEAYEHEARFTGEINKLAYKNITTSIKNCIYEQKFTLQNIGCLLERASRAVGTFRDITDQRDGYVMKTLARLSKRAADETSALTEQTIREAQIMKSITLLALVFLPATFIVGFLNLNYISVTKTSGGGLKLEAKTEMLLLLALAIPLTTLVIGGWYTWQYRSSLKRLCLRIRQKSRVLDVEKTQDIRSLNMGNV